jgi:DNA-binding transcriptional LysR family regulator
MDLGDLAIFRAVIREGSIRGAAEKLFRVQSNVTTRIRQLEDDLGAPLFVREGKKKLVPSPAGRILEDYAHRLIALAAEARAAVADGLPRGRLRIGTPVSIAATRMAPVLASFRQRYSDVQLELRTGTNAMLVKDVLDGNLECALVVGPVVDPRLTSSGVFEDELMVMTAADHPPIVHAADLATRTLLVFEPGCAYRQRLESWFAAEGLVPEQYIELPSYPAIYCSAACGMGVAVVPKALLANLPLDGSVSVHPLPAEQARVNIVLVQRAGVRSPAVQAFLDFMQTIERLPEAAEDARVRRTG